MCHAERSPEYAVFLAEKHLVLPSSEAYTHYSCIMRVTPRVAPTALCASLKIKILGVLQQYVNKKIYTLINNEAAKTYTPAYEANPDMHSLMM